MPKITIKKIIEANSALIDLTHNDRESKFVLPMSIRLRLGVNLRQTRPLAEEYESKRAALVEKYGVPFGTSGQYRVKPESMADFKAEHDALLKEEFEVTLSPLKEADLGENQIPIDTLVALQDAGLLV